MSDFNIAGQCVLVSIQISFTTTISEVLLVKEANNKTPRESAEELS